jgi:hypothetical protein
MESAGSRRAEGHVCMWRCGTTEGGEEVVFTAAGGKGEGEDQRRGFAHKEDLEVKISSEWFVGLVAVDLAEWGAESRGLGVNRSRGRDCDAAQQLNIKDRLWLSTTNGWRPTKPKESATNKKMKRR